jgi:hypothetical protein
MQLVELEEDKEIRRDTERKIKDAYKKRAWVLFSSTYFIRPCQTTLGC